MIAHCVFFWLREGQGTDLSERILSRAQAELGAIAGVRSFLAGRPVPSTRKVVDSSYDVALSMQFASAAELHEYLRDPVHVKFVDEVVTPLVERVLVYDFEPGA